MVLLARRCLQDLHRSSILEGLCLRNLDIRKVLFHGVRHLLQNARNLATTAWQSVALEVQVLLLPIQGLIVVQPMLYGRDDATLLHLTNVRVGQLVAKIGILVDATDS